MPIRVLALCLTGLLLLISCHGGEDESESTRHDYSVEGRFILKNGTPLNICGVVYVPGYPGYLPWELEDADELPDQLLSSIGEDIASIKMMGANTIRFWSTIRQLYVVLSEVGDLNFIQTISIDGDFPDFQNSVFKENLKAHFRETVDRIYSVFTHNDPPLIAFLIGNELSSASIEATDAAHPEITGYTGTHITTGNDLTATEAFLAEMADYLKTYEQENFGRVTLVSYANYLYTADIIDTPFLDFRCHNVYTYDIPYVRPGTAPGSHTGTLYQGWLEELLSRYPYLPLLVTETGLSVSPNAPHSGPPHYGYGGNTEEEQATCLVQSIIDVNSTILPLAGLCIHEYLDAWWKFGLEDSYTQDPDDVEEWFGLVRIVEEGDWYRTEMRPAYYAIQEEWGE